MGYVLKAMGKQNIAWIGNIISYFIINYPLGIYLAFYTDLKLIGLWIGW